MQLPDTMVLLLPFMSRSLKTPVDRLTVNDLSPRLVAAFSSILRRTACGGGTRNLRLGAIHSLAKFLGSHSPEHVTWCAEVRRFLSETTNPVMAYLDKPEMERFWRHRIEAPNRERATTRCFSSSTTPVLA